MAPEFDVNDNEIRSALETWRDSAQAQAERPEWFWARQRTRVMSEIRQPRRVSPKFAWAGIAAVVAVAISLLLPTEKPKPLPQPPAQAQQISDHDLMIAIERSMNAGGPASLAPASLLAEEMDQAYESQVSRSKDQLQKSKEKHYEN